MVALSIVSSLAAEIKSKRALLGKLSEYKRFYNPISWPQKTKGLPDIEDKFLQLRKIVVEALKENPNAEFINIPKKKYASFPHKIQIFHDSSEGQIRAYVSDKTFEKTGSTKRYNPCLGFIFNSRNLQVEQINRVARLRPIFTDSEKKNRENLTCAENESATLSKLNHKNVCQLFNYQNYVGKHKKGNQSKGEPHRKHVIYVRDYEKELFDWINDDRMPVIEKQGDSINEKLKVLKIIRSALRGLLAVHKKGIIHTDLKSENIFIDENGYANIADFDLATTLPWINKWGKRGSVPYLSPEKLHYVCNEGKNAFESLPKNNQLTLGLASDVWALGCVFYTLYTGCMLPWNEFILLNITTSAYALNVVDAFGRVVKENVKDKDSIILGRQLIDQNVKAAEISILTLKSKISNLKTVIDASDDFYTGTDKTLDRLKSLMEMGIHRNLNSILKLVELSDNKLSERDYLELQEIKNIIISLKQSIDGLSMTIWQKLKTAKESEDPIFRFIQRILQPDPNRRPDLKTLYNESKKMTKRLEREQQGS